MHARRVLPIGLQHDRVQLGFVLGRQRFAATVATSPIPITTAAFAIATTAVATAAIAVAASAVATAAVAIASAANRRRNLPGKLREQ